MSRKTVELTFHARLGKPHKRDGNILIYVPKVEAEIYRLKPGDVVEVSVRVLKRAEASNG